jgi:nucleoside-diphosphate-sugar epimerase
MKVLLTGYQGYIGAVAGPMLVAAGHEVVGVDADFFGGCDFGEPVDGVSGLRRDIRDLEAADVEGFDAVVHLAALSNDPLGNLDPELTWEINYRSSVRLAGLAREAGVGHFVFAS